MWRSAVSARVIRRSRLDATALSIFLGGCSRWPPRWRRRENPARCLARRLRMLAAVVAKMFLVDLSESGRIERIVSL